MKNKSLLLSLFLLMGCTSLNDSSKDLALTLTNVIDGNVKNATIKIDGEESTYSYINNEYKFKDKVSLNSSLEISHPRYETKTLTVKSLKSNEIDLSYEFKEIGSLMYNSDPLSSGWVIYSTRDKEKISFKFLSSSKTFENSSNVLSLYLNTKDSYAFLSSNDYQFKMTANKLFVYDFGSLHQEIDLNIFNYSCQTSNEGTTIHLDVPYSFIDITSDEIIGFNVEEYIYDKNIRIPLKYDNKIIDTQNTKFYPRLDIKCRTFMNTVNEDDPYWLSDTQYEELTKDKIYNFANPNYNRFTYRCDDVHFSLDYDIDSLTFDFIGFGNFLSTEFFQIVLHHDMAFEGGWKLNNKDLVLRVFNNRLEMYSNCTSFFNVTNGTLLKTIDIQTFINYGPYFTLDFTLPLSDITCISSNYDDIYMMAVEFDGIQIYDGINVGENFFAHGIACGDPANMASYTCVDAPLKRNSTLHYERKNEIIGDRIISFANPKDVLFSKADDMYMKVIRAQTSLTLDLVGFGDLSDVETIKIIFHTSSQHGTLWQIVESDKTLLFNKDASLFANSSKDFWTSSSLNDGVTNTNHTLSYNRYEEYFSLTLEIDYSEIGNDILHDTSIKMFAYEFGYAGIIYNSEPFTKLMRYNGEICGDPANQNNYIEI